MHFDFTLDYHSLILKREGYRGYYMATQRYEISIYDINTNEIQNHFT